jgi:hypothetical protein
VALTAAQIITQACQIAHAPGFKTIALNALNAILLDLAQTYDFDLIKKYFTFPFILTPAPGVNNYSYALGSGNVMPADFLRLCPEGSYYLISGVPYNMIGVTQAQFDRFVQQAGLNSFPNNFYIDIAQTPAVLFIWPPPSGAFQVSIRYFPTPADIAATAITNPNDAQTCWFPNTVYLYTRLAGEVMKAADDDRWQAFLGTDDPDKDTAGSACDILRRYLRMKDDPENVTKQVKLDRRTFRPDTSQLRNTKNIGW